MTINGGSTGVMGADGVLIDGDNDQQPGGNYIALLTVGRSINPLDATADREPTSGSRAWAASSWSSSPAATRRASWSSAVSAARPR